MWHPERATEQWAPASWIALNRRNPGGFLSPRGYALVHPNDEDRSEVRHAVVPGDAGAGGPLDGGRVDLHVKGERVVVHVEAGPGPFPFQSVGGRKQQSLDGFWQTVE